MIGVTDGFAARRDRLHEAAIAEVGADDFGSTDYLAGLDVLLDAIDAGPPLSPAGIEKGERFIISGLAGRLHSERGWKRYPGYRDTPLVAPILIMGVPRSGTTALHKLMSMDPQFQGLERWLCANPMPRPPRERWPDEPAYRATVAALEARWQAAPAAQKAHPVVADEPDECLPTMAQSFVSNWWGSNFDVPAYDSWFLRADETESYRRYADNLRLIGLNDGGQRWLLKNPSHIMGAEALLRVMPDAKLIHTVRDPAETVASLTNLMANIRGPLMGHAVDREAIGRRTLAWYAEAVRRAMAVEDARPDSVTTVDFREFVADPIGVVAGLYDRLGLTISAQAEAGMRAWIAANPKGKHGEHRYTLAETGVDRAEIDEQFADYIARYGLR